MSRNGKQLLKSALHLHSHFSLLRGTDSPDALLAWAAEAGYTAVALADVNGMYGAVPFYQAARTAGIKPILGVELLPEPDETPDADASGPAGRLTLLARTREGYRNLCRLTSLLQLEPARFSLLDEVVRHSEGLFVLCGRPDWLRPLARQLPRGQLGPLYAELTPSRNAEGRSRLRRLHAAATEAGVPPVAAIDSYFAAPSESGRSPGYQLHRVVTDIRLGGSNRRCRQPRREDYQSPDRRHWSASAMRDFFARCPEAVANANRIAEQCEDEVLELGVFHFPVSRVPRDHTSFSFLYRLCVRGLRRRYRPVRPEAVTRLANELAVIEKLGFADYFLFVHEIVAFARRRGIAVDVRGSAAASLVAYILGFTQVCPIACDLYFERFLHEGRTDCPDIDIDLCWRRRDEVIDFCYARWGQERVAMICTHNTMRARGAFVEVGKVMGLTPEQCFRLSRHIPEGIAGYLQRDWRELVEARRNLPMDDPHFRRILEVAGWLEGAPRHLGIHCGGLVIAPRPLTDYLPLQWATKGIVVTQYEMNAVEAIGLVKMDLLGNRALSEVAEAGKIISDFGLRISDLKQIEPASSSMRNPRAAIRNSLDEIDPEDPKTAALVSAGDTLGVFQAESPGMRHLCRQLRVSTREELAVALSVIRPGPAAVGMKSAYIARHLGEESPQYLHPKLEALLGRTYGVMLYQEDTMRVAVGIAGFTPTGADMLRKAVSKKRSPRRMAELRERFLAKAAEHTPDISPGAAAELWEQISHFAGYSFCRAHACVYGRIAWQTAWLKAHRPAVFYTAVFNNHMGMYPMRVHAGDAIRHGVTLLPPHVNRSEGDSTLQPDGAIRLGLRFVRGLSEGGIERIVAGRARRRGQGGRRYRHLAALRRSVRLSEPELTNLIRCGACDGLGLDRRAMLAEATLEAPVGELFMGAGVSRGTEGPRVDGEETANCKSQIGDRQLNSPACNPSCNLQSAVSASSCFPWAKPFTLIEKLQAEIDVLGLFLSRHPMDMLDGDWISTAGLAERVGRRVAVAGVLDATRTTQTRHGQLMRFVTLEDAAGLVECTFFPQAYERFGHLFCHLGPFRVEGVVENERGAITVNADRAESLVAAYPLTLAPELYPPSQIV